MLLSSTGGFGVKGRKASRGSSKSSFSSSSSSSSSSSGCVFIGVVLFVILLLIWLNLRLYQKKSLESVLPSSLLASSIFIEPKRNGKLPLLQSEVPVHVFENSTTNNISSLSSSFSSSPSLPFPGVLLSVLGQVRKALMNHPLQRLDFKTKSLDDMLFLLHSQKECQGKPIFVSMASIGSNLYWQLIENFVYSLVKFDLSDCAVMICVTDPLCVQMCADAGFPCYDFRYDKLHVGSNPIPSAMEQIAVLKLYHVPFALKRGVDVFMVDLDVGFLDSPIKLINRFMKSKTDAFVQKDITFIMNRSREGWRTWYTEPLPNIGLFLVKGNQKTYQMFDTAWKDYCTITTNIKKNPGKDQNKVVNAMRHARYTIGFRWEYIPETTAVLIDKIYKFEDSTIELGGQAAVDNLRKKGAVAAHTTCYEQKAKVNGLKAANAFWNPHYYDPQRPTITKQLVYTSKDSLLQEIRTLIYLAVALNRTLIVPNILGDETMGTG